MSGPDGLFRLLIVGVDGSDGSRRALEWAAGLSKATGAQVLVVHVLTYSREFIHDVMPETMRTWRRELEEELHSRWVEPLLAAGVEHRAVVVQDDSPAAALLDLADSEHADVLIVGAKGHGGFADRVLGSVSYRVTHRAHQPVVVVPPDWSALKAATESNETAEPHPKPSIPSERPRIVRVLGSPTRWQTVVWSRFWAGMTARGATPTVSLTSLTSWRAEGDAII